MRPTRSPARLLFAAVAAGVVGCAEGEAPADREIRHGARFDATAARHVVSGAPSCAGCSIVFEPAATLGSAGDPASIAPDAASVPCAIARLGNGDWAVSRVVGGGEVAVYGPGGRLQRTIGRQGAGPGEFGRDLRVLAGSDILLVVDNGNLRATALSPEGEVLSTTPLPGVLHAHALLDDGSLLTHGRPSGRPGDRRPLFDLVALPGGDTRGFGASTTEFMADLDQWVVAPSRDGGFWTASIWEYELYRWSGADSLTRTLLVESDLLPGRPDLSIEAFRRMHVETPPPPVIAGLHEDDTGLLWVFLLVPALDWRPSDLDPRTVQWRHDTFDTVVQVLDPREGRVLASERLEEVHSPACGELLAYTVVETAEGDTRARLTRLRLRRP